MFTTSIQFNCAVFDTGRTCAMARTAVAQVQSHDSLCEIYEGKMALGKIFLRGFWHCPVSVLYHKCFILVYIIADSIQRHQKHLFFISLFEEAFTFTYKLQYFIW
jgi:hypothetical protein